MGRPPGSLTLTISVSQYQEKEGSFCVGLESATTTDSVGDDGSKAQVNTIHC